MNYLYKRLYKKMKDRNRLHKIYFTYSWLLVIYKAGSKVTCDISTGKCRFIASCTTMKQNRFMSS